MKPGWVPALRIARRDARRARGRSILIMAMVAIPVFGATSIDLVARSLQLDPSESAVREVGHADAQLTYQGVSVEQANFFAGSPDRIEHLTISIGIAMYSQDAQFKQDLIEASDSALYEAKSAGRNRVVMYEKLAKRKEVS